MTSPLNRYRILIVDDHPVVRQGLAAEIGRHADLEVCGSAACVADALKLVEGQTPDAAIVDLSLEGEDGLELIDYIKSRCPATRIIAYSAHDEETYAGRVLRAGAHGYLCKREPMPKIVDAIRRVLEGEVYLTTHAATSLLQRAAVGKPLDEDPVAVLSNRELQVFEMIGQGMTTVQIGEKLGVSPKTIESHRKGIKTKLNLASSAQLSRRAFQWVGENS